MSLFDLFLPHLEERSLFLEWQQGDSDVDGCIELNSPKPIHCQLSLCSPHVPVACLLDELDAQDFTPQTKFLLHKNRSALFYDDRRVLSKRKYLQCVLARRDIFAMGQVICTPPHPPETEVISIVALRC